MGPLNHLRILDLSRILAGPWCGQNLADLGADVIKVERPGSGDDTREWGPPYLKDSSGQNTTEAAYYLAINRNKRSITLDISTPEGQEVIRKLIINTDVVIENYKVGQLKKYGLDYDSLKLIKPDLVYCSITGFGQNGPYSKRAGYDFIVQGMGGFMSVTGEKDDLPGGGPQKAGVAIADIFSGMYATTAILAAIAHRDKTGEGQCIDIALLDVQVAIMANMASNYLATGVAPKRWGNAHPNIVPYQTFQTADSWMIVAAGNDSQYRKFVEAGGMPELATDPRFLSNPDRVKNRDTLVPLLTEMTRKKSKNEWISLLEGVGVPCGPINTLDEVFENEQVISRGMKQAVDHPLAGKVNLVRNPILMSKTPLEIRSAPPTLGQHTKEILESQLGIDSSTIETWRSKNII
jgi:crotonobetainyl-CoA:carnitine CoA-transferase CaiB-like acyl-CoA transferase